jgi:4-hydroxybenzoate polyprenyltransferase
MAAVLIPAPANRPIDLLRLMRPHQWLKNALVLIGLLFGQAWTDMDVVTAVLLTVAAFCFASSATYIMNDLVDRASDRLHPEKYKRPLAAGSVSVRSAVLLGAPLAVLAILLASLASLTVLLFIVAYWTLSAGYTARLKHIVLLDVFTIAGGFMLRILAGTLGVGIAPSAWLLLCSLMLTLFFGFTKRRAEIMVMAETDGGFARGGHRSVLDEYTPLLLDKMIGVTASAVVMSYSLYTMSPATLALHGTPHLIYTVPLVVYGVFRYIYLVHARDAGSDTAMDFLRDRHLLLTGGAWLGVTLWLITA